MERETDSTRRAALGDVAVLKSILKTLYGGPRDELAERLIDRFGSFRAIFRADRAALAGVDGVTSRAADFFVFYGECMRRAVLGELTGVRLVCPADAMSYAAVYYMNSEEARADVLYLNDEGAVTFVERITDAATAQITACRRRVNSAILLLCRPREGGANGELATSVAYAFETIGVKLADMIVYDRHGAVSLAARARGRRGAEDYESFGCPVTRRAAEAYFRRAGIDLRRGLCYNIDNEKR